MMRNLTYILVLFFGLTFIMSAQPKVKKTPEQKAQAMVTRLQMKLKLTPDQASKAYTVILNLMNGTGGFKGKTKEEKLATIQKVTDEAQLQMKTILNNRQFVKYTMMMNHWKQKKMEKINSGNMKKINGGKDSTGLNK